MNLPALVLLATLSIPSSAWAKSVLDVDRIENTTIYFKASEGGPTPTPLKTELTDLKYIGPLRPLDSESGTPPYFLFSGRGCKNCQEDGAIYALRANGEKPTAFVHPGRLLDPKSKGLLMESRAFFGRCLWNQKDEVYVVFQKENVDRRHQMQPSVLIATPGGDHLNERLIERHLPRLQDTLRLVKSKVCKEIDGRNRVMNRQKLNLRRSEASLEQADDDEKDREKSTPETDSP